VSWGVLNLAHRKGNEFPRHMVPEKAEQVSIQLDECGYRFLPGHRIRLSISTSYWPMIMPPPEKVTAKIKLGASTYLTLPIRSDSSMIEVPEPENLNLLPEYTCHLPPAHRRSVEKDVQNNMTHYRVYDDTGDYEMPVNGMRTRHTHEECWSIAPDDPLTSTATSTYTCYMSRGDWKIRTVSESSLHCDRENFFLQATVTAWEGENKVSNRRWEQTIKRDFL
jgi:hypothetical protein